MECVELDFMPRLAIRATSRCLDQIGLRSVNSRIGRDGQRLLVGFAGIGQLDRVLAGDSPGAHAAARVV